MVFQIHERACCPNKGVGWHLATVYDSDARSGFTLTVSLTKRLADAIAHPARFGPAQIGNWDRKLSRRIDEFIILGRAMSDEEVNCCYHDNTLVQLTAVETD